MKFNLNAENINYLKIIYRDKNDFSHCIKAAIKNINSRDIDACAKFEDFFSINTPQIVELNFATENGLYKTKAELKYTAIEQPYINFIFKTPEEMEYYQNREYFRVKLSENTVISVASFDGSKQISGETFDISANGVRIIIDDNYQFPEFADITLYLPERTIVTEAKYVRTDEEDNIKKASFSFINLSEADLNYLSQICFKMQLEARRKNLL